MEFSASINLVMALVSDLSTEGNVESTWSFTSESWSPSGQSSEKQNEVHTDSLNGSKGGGGTGKF